MDHGETLNNPFLAGSRFISPSLNRARIVELPGAAIPPWALGRSGYELLSAEALVIQINQNPILVEAATGKELSPVTLEHFLSLEDPGVQAEAEKIAARYGQGLGYLLLMLKRGDRINRAARSDWMPVHWDYWRAVDKVWIGGGLVSGGLGAQAATQATRVLCQNGFADFRVEVSAYGAALPLIGAARYLPVGVKHGLVLDFGQSSVKRGHVSCQEDRSYRLARLPNLPSPCTILGMEDRTDIEEHAQRILKTVLDTRSALGVPSFEPVDHTVISLACYLRNGQPISEENGCYARLQRLTDNLEQYFSEQLSGRLTRPIFVKLVHDASAAAAIYAGNVNAAVLTLGTAIGVGFPPPEEGLLVRMKSLVGLN